MNRKQRAKRHSGTVMARAVRIMLRFIFMGLSLFAVCAPHASLAGLTWYQTSAEIKLHPLQASETVEFAFTNSGSNTVSILALKPACSCLSGTTDKTAYTPGESGVVRVVFNAESRLGALRKSLAVKTDDVLRKTVILTVSTTIPETYRPAVKRLIWAEGEAREPKTCRITNLHKQPFKLVRAVPDRTDVHVELKMIREGFDYELTVVPEAGLKNVLIPIHIYPALAPGLDQVKHFTVYALLK